MPVLEQAQQGDDRNLCGAHTAENISKLVSGLTGVAQRVEWKMNRETLAKQIAEMEGELKEGVSATHWYEALASIQLPGAYLTEQALEILLRPNTASHTVQTKLRERSVYIPSPFAAQLLSHGQTTVLPEPHTRKQDKLVIFPFNTGKQHWMTLVWDRSGEWKSIKDHFWLMDSLPSDIHTEAAKAAIRRIRSAYAQLETEKTPKKKDKKGNGAEENDSADTRIQKQDSKRARPQRTYRAGGWTCGVCTYRNAHAAVRCEMCHYGVRPATRAGF
eukprot:CAMPEP_0170182850 /NCGR_PEP_ID=MMETSP0040_2-20121228/28962_1 /TAXON_ID=641309 /ORGANISM="Lotharella oceanica, Strain CCMP622" /LENGTH=273 /DNA_ID=CAMNT_0010428409 /DNA_START=304 /DNA_END=1125 /DNA_ORIENTATION=-